MSRRSSKRLKEVSENATESLDIVVKEECAKEAKEWYDEITRKAKMLKKAVRQKSFIDARQKYGEFTALLKLVYLEDLESNVASKLTKPETFETTWRNFEGKKALICERISAIARTTPMLNLLPAKLCNEVLSEKATAFKSFNELRINTGAALLCEFIEVSGFEDISTCIQGESSIAPSETALFSETEIAEILDNLKLALTSMDKNGLIAQLLQHVFLNSKGTLELVKGIVKDSEESTNKKTDEKKEEVKKVEDNVEKEEKGPANKSSDGSDEDD